MALAVETPARNDLSFRTNDDKLVGYRWWKSDGITPVTIASAVFTLSYQPPTAFDPVTCEPLPLPLPVVHTIDSAALPGASGGWVDAAGLPQGNVLVYVPHAVWALYEPRSGMCDCVAVGEGVQRCLARGRFVVEVGAS